MRRGDHGDGEVIPLPLISPKVVVNPINISSSLAWNVLLADTRMVRMRSLLYRGYQANEEVEAVFMSMGAGARRAGEEVPSIGPGVSIPFTGDEF